MSVVPHQKAAFSIDKPFIADDVFLLYTKIEA